MSLHTHKTRSRPGVAEFVCVLLVGLVVILLGTVVWTWRLSSWKDTRGFVVSAHRIAPASTALATAQLLRLEYYYIVAGTTFGDVWEGDWPDSLGSATSPSTSLDTLMEPGYRLRISYNPSNPKRNRLHIGGGGPGVIGQRMALGLALALWLGLLHSYPRLNHYFRE